MALILRVDVDKPYGRATFFEKVLSKIREDYWFPALPFIGYLKHLQKFLEFLDEEKIIAHIYFRKCTLPLLRYKEYFKLEKHAIGVHVENTKNYNTFKKEIDDVGNYLFPLPINSFTKHGSGTLKLGKNHFPPYEPDKYSKWAHSSNIPYLFGNEELNTELSYSTPKINHFPCVFWIDRITGKGRYQLNDIIEISKKQNVVIIIHPANFVADQNVEKDMRYFVSLSKKHHIDWISI